MILILKYQKPGSCAQGQTPVQPVLMRALPKAGLQPFEFLVAHKATFADRQTFNLIEKSRKVRFSHIQSKLLGLDLD